MLRVLAYRRSLGAPSPDERRHGRDQLRMIERQAVADRELAGNLVELMERLGPARESPSVASAAVDAGPPPVPSLRPPRASDP
jgi:hypothetical protein